MAHASSDMHSSVLDEAAWWFVRLRSDDAGKQDHEDFSAWLEQDEQNRIVYREYADMWDDLDDCAGSDAVMDMRRDALAYLPNEETVTPWWKYASIAASLALVCTAVMALWPSPVDNAGSSAPAIIAEAPERVPSDAAEDKPVTQLAVAPQDAVYRTSVGQRSTINLPDGSVLELNTDSMVQVNYSRDHRDLILLRGEALFRVAKDKSRPFTVEADGKRVTALGTVFAVRRAADDVHVTLVEGSVTVDRFARNGNTLSSIKLVPGQQLVARSHHPFKVQPVNLRAATSWREGRLVFDNKPLQEIVAEMNRYSSRKIVIGDEELSNLRVSGTFSVGSVDSFSAALEASFPVVSHEDAKSGKLVLQVRP